MMLDRQSKIKAVMFHFTKDRHINLLSASPYYVAVTMSREWGHIFQQSIDHSPRHIH